MDKKEQYLRALDHYIETDEGFKPKKLLTISGNRANKDTQQALQLLAKYICNTKVTCVGVGDKDTDGLGFFFNDSNFQFYYLHSKIENDIITSTLELLIPDNA